MHTLGDRFREARSRATPRLSQRALGAKLEISGSSIAQWETGETRPDMEHLVRACSILGVRPEYIVLGQLPIRRDAPAAIDEGRLVDALQLVERALADSSIDLPGAKRAQLVALVYSMLDDAPPAAELLTQIARLAS